MCINKPLHNNKFNKPLVKFCLNIHIQFKSSLCFLENPYIDSLKYVNNIKYPGIDGTKHFYKL